MTVRITWARAALALLLLGALGMLVAWSGVISVAASSGHWRITYWFLHWSMENSVRTQAALHTPEDARARDGLISAAGHFAQSCAVCHGAPGVRQSPVTRSAMPDPPVLAGRIGRWSDRELFWILQHGIKYSGMPAWAAKDRPDEIRRMVGFLRHMPAMTPRWYRALVLGPDAQVAGVVPGVVARCTGCHGADGRGRGQADIPVLGGQKPAYLEAALRAYATNRRSSAVMRAAAATLNAGEMRALARHFAAMPGLHAERAAPIDARAHRIATRGLPERQLPACLGCHDPRRASPAPILHGQHAAYTSGRLHRWRGSEDVVDAHKSQAVMPVIARRIPEEMIEPLARYFARNPSS